MIGGDSVEICDICQNVYRRCAVTTNQAVFIDLLFEAAGGKTYIAKTYKKQIFTGKKPFTENQKMPLRNKDCVPALKEFFYSYITEDEIVKKIISAFGIPEKETPDKLALCTALAVQVKAIIDSTEEADNIMATTYQAAKQEEIDIKSAEDIGAKYPGDSVYVSATARYEIGIYDKVEHTWEITNTGKQVWSGRKLVYIRGAKDRPEANPSVIEIKEVKQMEKIKISTTFDGRGFAEVTHCHWEMQDADGENCFPKLTSRFDVIIDAQFKCELLDGGKERERASN